MVPVALKGVRTICRKCTLDTLPKSRIGSFGYVAPEVLLNKKDVDTRKADCWSVGVILYQLLFGEHPFERPSDQEEGSVKRTLHRIVQVHLFCSCVFPLSTSMHLLLCLRLYKRPKWRVTAGVTKRCLLSSSLHRWSTGYHRMHPPHRKRWTCCSMCWWRTLSSATAYRTCRCTPGMHLLSFRY